MAQLTRRQVDLFHRQAQLRLARTRAHALGDLSAAIGQAFGGSECKRLVNELLQED
ncbi:hypothetical protein [Luteimonas terricola]|uniref:Uncharacterized protein n=1 Tax=Luteimonas terricola TaxID=645597 RepID=A0ABQ2EE30_9GAMM|nr:hypothetical protein [Luteimonas terricola]GGK08552.1 hypothetical protein GCM10011394_17430 [Luteimonas terricola]